jgi:multidrug efflux pump subunit AcrB
MNSQSAVSISIKKRTGYNVVELVEELDEIIARRAGELPSGVTVVKVGDLAKFVKSLVRDLENNLASGFVLVLVVVFFSMGFRNAALVSLSIPLSMLIAFVVLDAMGVTLNMIVLFSMTLALGMLVDSAIVIIENIYRFMQAGVPRVRAACRATAEVAWPIIGSMLTTIMAFAPLLVWPGIMGSVFKYLPITVITILTSCLLVALVVNPALAATFMKRPPRVRGLSVEDVEKAGEAPVETTTGILGLYRRALGWCLGHRAPGLLASALVVVLSVQTWLLVIGLERPMSFMPAVDADNVHIQIAPPEGTGLDHNDAIVREVELRIRGTPGKGGRSTDLPDIEHFVAKAALGGGGFQFGPGSGAPNLVTVAFVGMEERERRSGETAKDIRERMKGIPGAEISVIEEEKGPPTGAPVNLEITGDDLEVLGRLAAEVRSKVENVPFVHEVRDDYVVGVPTVRVRVDRKKAALVGLTTQAVGFALKYAFTVRLPDDQRDGIDTLERFFIPTMTGELVPLTSIADIVYEGGYATINRKDHKRTVTVTAQIDKVRTTGDNARKEAERNLAELRAKLASSFPGYDAKFTGQLEFQKDAQEFLGRAFLMALFAIAIILIAIFNSVSQPFIIMTSVVLSIGTAFLGLAVKELPFVLIMSGIGFISLAGVVVNNAIVLVDYTNKLRQRGYALDEAVIGAGATRLRPVLLTAITTILGLVPLVTGVAFDFRKFRFASASESSQWWTPMAICVIFGLALATFLTLVVVPCLYHVIESAKRWLISRKPEAPRPR